MTTSERDLIEMLREIVGPGKPGYPTVLDYYHDVDACELPENCGHCRLVRKARELLRRIDSEKDHGGDRGRPPITLTKSERTDVDNDHDAKPYDPVLRAGFCLVCRLPIRIDDLGQWTHAPGAPSTPVSKS